MTGLPTDTVSSVRPAIVLFDCVGTLMEPQPPASEVYARAARRYGSRLDASAVATRFRTALHALTAQRTTTSEPAEKSFWRDLVARVIDDVEPIDELFDQLWNHFARPDSWRLYPDVAPAWELLKRSQVAVGVATNFDARLRGIAAALPPLDGCQHLFISSELGHRKPSPHFFAAVTQSLGLLPARIALVGDDPTLDVAAARDAGWQATLVDRSDRGVSPTPLERIARRFAALPRD